MIFTLIIKSITRFNTEYTNGITRFNVDTLNNSSIIVYTSDTVEFNADTLNNSCIERFDIV